MPDVPAEKTVEKKKGLTTGTKVIFGMVVLVFIVIAVAVLAGSLTVTTTVPGADFPCVIG